MFSGPTQNGILTKPILQTPPSAQISQIRFTSSELRKGDSLMTQPGSADKRIWSQVLLAPKLKETVFTKSSTSSPKAREELLPVPAPQPKPKHTNPPECPAPQNCHGQFNCPNQLNRPASLFQAVTARWFTRTQRFPGQGNAGYACKFQRLSNWYIRLVQWLSTRLCAFFGVYVQVEALRRADHPPKESYRMSKI